MRTYFIVIAISALILGCGSDQSSKATVDLQERSKDMNITVTSAAFKEGEAIPKEYTGEGPDVSPQISWNAVKDAKSYALICDDPDAPRAKPWVHWVIYNIETITELPKNVEKKGKPGNVKGALQGKTDFGKIGYGGPMPPKGHGVHHYHFKLYALDVKLDVKEGLTKEQLEASMKGHILCEGKLIGTYRRD